jgi:methionyl-tRNA synthetase
MFAPLFQNCREFKPEDIGKKSYCFSEFAPRNLRGVESQGMILMMTMHEGKLVFVNPDTGCQWRR